MPKFGHEGEGGLTMSIENYIRGSVFPCPEVGTATKLTAYIANTSSTLGKAKGMIYKHSDWSLVAASDEVTIDKTSTKWYDFILSGVLEADDYVLVAWADTPGAIRFVFDAGAENQGHNQSIAYGEPPNPADFAHSDRKYCIFCTYTTEAPPVGRSFGIVIG